MPTDWTYHADGVNTAVSTSHDLDGTIQIIALELDTFRVRDWEPMNGPESSVDLAGEKIPEHTHWDEEDRVYREHGDGAHATLRFTVAGGVAWLLSIEPEDGDELRPKHMPLLKAAERIVTNVDGVDSGSHTIGEFTDAYEQAEGIHIDALDE